MKTRNRLAVWLVVVLALCGVLFMMKGFALIADIESGNPAFAQDARHEFQSKMAEQLEGEGVPPKESLLFAQSFGNGMMLLDYSHFIARRLLWSNILTSVAVVCSLMCSFISVFIVGRGTQESTDESEGASK